MAAELQGQEPRGLSRLSHAQREVLKLLRTKEAVSYDEMAASLQIDRKTAIQAIRRLTLLRRVVVVAGRGREPNRYLLTDEVIACN